MDIELHDQGSKSDTKPATSGEENSSGSCCANCVNKILEGITSISGLEKDCLLATLSYYSRLVIWTAFLYFYVGGIGAISALYTLRAILGYIFLLVFLVFLRLYYVEYYEILKWFATPSLIFLKSWTSLFFFAYLVLLPSDLNSVRFDQIVSWIFQVGFGNIVSLALTVMVINVILWMFSLFISKEDPESPPEEKKNQQIEESKSSKSIEAEEVEKDFKPSITTPSPSMDLGASGGATATVGGRRESTMSSLSVGLRTSFAVDAALGRMSLQAYGEAKYLQYALSKGSKHSVDEVGATVHEDEFDRKVVRLSMKQAIYGSYNLAEMTRPASLMRGSGGNLPGLTVSTSGNNISGLADVNRESIVVKKNNARLVMIHNMDYDGAMRGSLSRMSGVDRASLTGVKVRPVTGRFKPTSPKANPLPPTPSLGLSAIAAGPHSLHNTLHTEVRPMSMPRSPKSSPNSDGRKHTSRPLPEVPDGAAKSEATIDAHGTVNPLIRSVSDGPPSGMIIKSPLLRGPTSTSIGNLDVIEEGEDEDRATEVSRTQSIDYGVSSAGPPVPVSMDSAVVADKKTDAQTTQVPFDDYEMEYPDEAMPEDAPLEEEISIALPFIPTMQQLFVFWQYIAVFTALITYLMPTKTHGSVVAFQLSCSILAFIVSTTYRTALLGKFPLWVQMPLQSFVIFTPIVILLVILSSTEGVHNWQGCLNQYIIVPNGIVQDISAYGAGNFLVMFLNPAIVSLAFSTVDPLIEYYQLLPLMIPAVVISCLIITIQNASISRMLASPSVIAHPLLIRTVTIPIAIEITNAISASAGITVASVLVNAVLALRLYPTYLTYMKVNSPVTRGISCGLCGTLLGVVSLDDRGESVAAGIGMAGFGIATISFGLIMTLAAFRDFVCQLS